MLPKKHAIYHYSLLLMAEKIYKKSPFLSLYLKEVCGPQKFSLVAYLNINDMVQVNVLCTKEFNKEVNTSTATPFQASNYNWGHLVHLWYGVIGSN
jgi:hypothetical protein